jgi:large subunit ribosomal protein L23
MSILKGPIVTEKISELNESGKYGFLVHKDANKVAIKKEIEKLYNVNVEKIWTIRYQGKTKSRMTKSRAISGRAPGFKKAIIKIAEGEVIDFYSGL